MQIIKTKFAARLRIRFHFVQFGRDFVAKRIPGDSDRAILAKGPTFGPVGVAKCRAIVKNRIVGLPIGRKV